MLSIALLRAVNHKNISINVVCCGVGRVELKYEKVGVLRIQIVKSNVSSVGYSSERRKNMKSHISNNSISIYVCIYVLEYKDVPDHALVVL